MALEVSLFEVSPQASPEGSKQVVTSPRAQTTVTVKDQETIVLGGFIENQSPTEQTMLVVTPYIIWSDADLRTLLECKRKLAREAHSGG